MSYNKFRWYTDGRYRNNPLPSNSPLLLKIKNSDFEFSPFFREAEDARIEYQKLFDYFMKTSKIKETEVRKVEAHEYAKMKNVKALKLDEKADEEEEVRLSKLREELTSEFGKDLWVEALKNVKGNGTTEDLYWWYKNKLGMGSTPSELAISMGRKTTKGLK